MAGYCFIACIVARISPVFSFDYETLFSLTHTFSFSWVPIFERFAERMWSATPNKQSFVTIPDRKQFGLGGSVLQKFHCN